MKRGGESRSPKILEISFWIVSNPGKIINIDVIIE